MELYYYTSSDTMKYILTQGDIFATNIHYMNDSEEYLNGLNELYQLAQNKLLLEEWLKRGNRKKDLLNNIRNTFSEKKLKINKDNMEYYSISLCKKNDLLSQWAIYARESGVSVKMNFEKTTYRFSTGSTEKDCDAEWNLLPKEVYYFTHASMKDNEKLYNQTAYKILDQLYEGDAKDNIEFKNERWKYISTFVKRYDFYQEEEYRLVFEPNQSVYPPSIQYRHDKKMLKPYLDIKCDGGWPVWEIMIGPGFNQQIVYDSIKHFLENTHIKVGIETESDFVNRIQRYLEPCNKYLDSCNEYKELFKLLLDEEWLKNSEFEEIKIILMQKIRAMQSEIFEEDNYNDTVKEYFARHQFTNSGVILSKSSIPYIF